MDYKKEDYQKKKQPRKKQSRKKKQSDFIDSSDCNSQASSHIDVEVLPSQRVMRKRHPSMMQIEEHSDDQ